MVRGLAWLLLNAIVIVSFSSSTAFCKELRWTHYGVRPLAMGNAFVAVADDFNAIFYNPAGLARLKTWDGELFNFKVEVSQRTVSFIEDLKTLIQGGATDTTEVLELLKEQSGKLHHMEFGLTPHLIFPHFGMGLGLDFQMSMVPHSNIDIEVNSGLNMLMPIAVAFNFLEERLSVGAGVKLRAKGGIDESFNIQTISAFTKTETSGKEDSSSTQLQDLFKAGWAAGGDVGMLFTPIKTMEPTFGLSITDIGGVVFNQANVGGTAIGTPSPILPSVNSGISLKPWQTEKSYVLVSCDTHMLNQPVHFSKKLNFGTEYGYSQIIKLQAGLKEGYATAGFQFDVGLLNLRFATYTVDHGEVVGTEEDLAERRFTVQLKLLI